MRIKNTTDLPLALLRRMVAHCRPPGLPGGFDVMVRNGFALAGRAYTQGSAFHDRRRVPFIVARIPGRGGPVRHCAYAHEGMPVYWTGNREEGALVLIAHELRHLWQGRKLSSSRRGYFPRTRGRFSERDCECWALNRLRAWRRQSCARSDNSVHRSASVSRRDPFGVTT